MYICITAFYWWNHMKSPFSQTLISTWMQRIPQSDPNLSQESSLQRRLSSPGHRSPARWDPFLAAFSVIIECIQWVFLFVKKMSLSIFPLSWSSLFSLCFFVCYIVCLIVCLFVWLCFLACLFADMVAYLFIYIIITIIVVVVIVIVSNMEV